MHLLGEEPERWAYAVINVVRNADWIIDLGPEGGSRGGQVMFEGTPADLKKARQSITSQYL